MKFSRRSFTALLLTLGSLAAVGKATACKYCYSAENAEAADYARQAMSAPAAPNNAPGAFPLDSTINGFQSSPAPAALTTTPAPGAVVTSAADLRAARGAAPAAVAPIPTATTPAVAAAPRASTHYADAGLLGLAAVGGVFCWRTRRKTGTGR